MTIPLRLDPVAQAQATALLPQVQAVYAPATLDYVITNAMLVGLRWWRPVAFWPPAAWAAAIGQPADVPTAASFTPSAVPGTATYNETPTAEMVGIAAGIIAALGGVPTQLEVLGCAACTGLSVLSGEGPPVALVPPVDFTAAVSSGGVFSFPPSWLSISCATTGRTVQTSASTLVTGIGANAWRARNAGVATGLSVESAVTNALSGAGSPSQASGPTAGIVTQTSGQSDPAGGTGATLFASSGDQYSNYWTGLTGNSSSVWVKWASGVGVSGLVAKWRSDPNIVGVSTSQTSWGRIDVASVTVGTGVALFDNRASPAGPDINVATSWYGAFAQYEPNAYPSSWINISRAADVLSTTSPVAPSGLLNAALTVAPNFATAEQAHDSPLIWWDANNQVFLRQSDAKIVVKVGGSVVLTSAALTWSREQGLSVSVLLTDVGLLTLSVTGATSGNGETEASGVAAFTTQPTTYLLGTSSGATECCDLRAIAFYAPSTPATKRGPFS